MDMFSTDFAPSATGLLQCLRLLAQEAAALNLVRTLSAIEDALDTAAYESGMEAAGDGGRDAVGHPVIH